MFFLWACHVKKTKKRRNWRSEDYNSGKWNLMDRNSLKLSRELNDCHWVPELRGRKPVLISQIDANVIKVKDLMCGGGKMWDDRLIRALFRQDDAEEILKKKGLKPLTDDVWSCSFSKKGIFSVKAVYPMLLK
ncbi:thiazole synthase [Striga asiatica]|uniref:Thiazole synthase n=1 Tax=Striga asiatica TaxID=4170 RepID=A0A5A7P4H6_STRAF|nr:thiazole synthase [Striga asiatica]